jgi:hypothetical protein
VETDPGVDLLLALGEEARLENAAKQLAMEAFLLGEHVDESEPLAENIRLAAKDEPTAAQTTRYTDGRLELTVTLDADGLQITQQTGRSGITVVFGPTRIPLQPGLPARAPDVTTLPPTLSILDRKGRRRTLRPDPSSR